MMLMIIASEIMSTCTFCLLCLTAPTFLLSKNSENNGDNNLDGNHDHNHDYDHG